MTPQEVVDTVLADQLTSQRWNAEQRRYGPQDRGPEPAVTWYERQLAMLKGLECLVP